jgi:tRNA A-37 threonylcarbamoyl transferase component Bud32
MIMTKKLWGGFKLSSSGNHLPCEDVIPDELDVPHHHRSNKPPPQQLPPQQLPPPPQLPPPSSVGRGGGAATTTTIITAEPPPLPTLRSRVRSYPDIRHATNDNSTAALFFKSSRSASQQRHCSPNFLLPVNEDDGGLDTQSPPVILTNSPITAPKTTWDYHYGFFLKQQNRSTTSTSTRNALRWKGGPVLPPPPPEMLSARSSSLGTSSAMSTPLGSSPSDMLTAGGSSPKHRGSSVDNEPSVRGGKLFSGLMFRSVSSNDHHEQQQQQQQQQQSKLWPNRRSSFSSAASSQTDELDETKRRGVDRAYSPGNPRFRKEQQHRLVVSSSVSSSHNNNNNDATVGSSTPRFPLLIPPLLQLQQQQSQQQLQQQSQHETTAGVVIANCATTTKNSPLRSPKSSAMKKIFTDFHNSTANTEVPYLGDETSIHNARSVLWSSKSQAPPFHHHHHQPGGHSRSNAAIATAVQLSSNTILRPVRGVETWMKGRRYLLGPAVYAACHPQTLLHLQSPVAPLAGHVTDGLSSLLLSSHATTTTTTDICLGDCWLSNAAIHDNTKQSSLSSSSEWTNAHLIVRQNYLLDFASADSITTCGPRGMLHLAYAVARPHEHFADTIYLSCYGSPCAQADPKRLLLRICRTAAGTTCSPEERSIVRQQVVDCLNRAANLTLNDIYEMSDDQESSLGQSQYVQVRAVRKRRTGNDDDDDDATRSCRQRALKIFDKNKFWKAVVKGQERADTIVREISIQATLSAHQCRSSAATTHAADVPIVRIYGFFETATEIAIELERLEGTDLFRYVSSKNVLSEAEAARILKDVLTALDTMSSLGLAHRDIKPANILMSSPSTTSSNDDPRTAVGVKVGDFGMSTYVDVDGLVRGRCGTPGYVAPEIFETGAYGGYGNKVDVFSAGVTLYVCLCGYEPFYGETDQELKEANRRATVDFPPDEWKHISPSAIDLIQQMMRVDPTRRPSAREALAHHFFTQAAAAATAGSP